MTVDTGSVNMSQVTFKVEVTVVDVGAEALNSVGVGSTAVLSHCQMALAFTHLSLYFPPRKIFSHGRIRRSNS